MISIDEARWILSHVDTADVARRTWRACVKSGCYAATVLDLETGRICTNFWPAAPRVAPDVTVLALAAVSSERREALGREASLGTEVSPSPEVIEEEAVRRAIRAGLPWAEIEERLERVYRIRGDRGAA